MASLKKLENDETLIVQSGKPVAVFKTHAEAPRVLISNAMIVPHWANWDEFRRLEALGLTMYGQMTAGSWIYIGTQGILQGTYETLSAVARKHFGGSLKGTLTLTAGLGGMGGAQPLAVTMNDGVAIVVECDPHRIERRLETKYVDTMTESLDEALRLAGAAMKKGEPLSIALLGNAADVLPEFVRRGITPDVLTDQTSAHDELNGYVPNGLAYEDALALRKKDPAGYIARSYAAMAAHVEAMLELRKRGARAFDYGNNIRGQAQQSRGGRGLRHPRVRPGVHPAALLPRQGAVPLGGAVRQAAGHLRHRRGRARGIPRGRGPGPLDPQGPRPRSSSRACRRASAGSATASGPASAPSSTTW